MNQLKHLYISPLEQCNLRCRMCYTTKSQGRLSNEQILAFIDGYQKVQPVETVTYCGGEVFMLADFPALVNQTQQRGIFTQIITNGTFDRLTEINRPNECNLIVSLDGLPDYHDRNRGLGNWQRSVDFLHHAQKLGFHFEVFSIVTRQNLAELTAFEEELKTEFGRIVEVTYHPRKPPAYLEQHPVSCQCPQVEGFDFLVEEKLSQLRAEKKVFPPPELGCFQVALMSDGKVYGCCEGITPLGSIDDTPELLLAELRSRLDFTGLKSGLNPCLGCTEKDFRCGLS